MAIYWLYFKSEILAFEVHSETQGWEKMSQIYFQAIPRGSEEMERKRRHCADGPRVPGSLIFSAFVVVWYFSTINGCYKQEWFFFNENYSVETTNRKEFIRGKSILRYGFLNWGFKSAIYHRQNFPIFRWWKICHSGSVVAVWGIQFSDPGSNPRPLHWEHGVLATGPPGSPCTDFFSLYL